MNDKRGIHLITNTRMKDVDLHREFLSAGACRLHIFQASRPRITTAIDSEKGICLIENRGENVLRKEITERGADG